MKVAIITTSAVIGILATSSCSKPTSETKSIPGQVSSPFSPTPSPAAQDYVMIRTILNASPANVSKVLGAPDGPIKPSRDCDYLPACSAATYQHKKFEALFYKNRLKWITVDRPGMMTEDLPSRLGFRSSPPTFVNPGEMIAWRSAEKRGTARGPLVPIEGIREIMACSDFAFITVAVGHDHPF